MENPKPNYFFTVFIRILKWFSVVISVALFLSGVRWFYLKINQFPKEIEKRIANAKKEDKDDKHT